MKRHQGTHWGPWTIAGLFVLACLIGVTSRTATAWERYSDGCVQCHGDYFGGFSPKGTTFPANSIHEMHKNQAFIGGACTLCHGGPGNEADYLSASGGTESNPGIGCVGCHGRSYDGMGVSGVGLRAVHDGLCIGCHPNDPEPLPENVAPPYYNTPDTNATDPCNQGPAYGENFSVDGEYLGLDNDGDGRFDTDDPDCSDPAFELSLHYTRNGKNWWYGEENGGFESFTGVPIEDLGCTQCHGPTDADGNPYQEPYEPSCVDCHQTGSWDVEQSQCLSCHGRQKTVIMALGYSDVHRDLGFQCWDCHGDIDMHGDGMTEHDTMFQSDGTTQCEDCHNDLPASHDDADPHGGALHCSACHEQTVVSCYNCHFESQLDGVKRAKQPIHDFVLLANRESDGKVGTISFQSLTYQGDSFAAFGPFTGHTITAEGRTCDECHVNFGGENEAIQQYNDTGQIKFAQWDDEIKQLSWLHGVVPMPVDYQETFRMDFLTYTGDTSDPPPGDPNLWTGIGEDTWDGHQMFFASPLTEDQMAALGFNTGGGGFEVALHYTRNGKNWWYGEENGGFESFTGVPIEDLGCTQCHGPTDANGDPYEEPYEPSCVDCHATDSEWEVSQDQCFGCHGRQKTVIQALGYSDVHRTAGFQCWDCHGDIDMHGDGVTEHDTMFQSDGTTQCEDCHNDLPASHDDADPHGGALHCSACHEQTVISCYNCHFESQVDGVKRAKQPIHDFVLLANRDDGKVGTISFQSLTYQGDSFVAFGPFTGHTITAEGRTCAECHVNFGGENEAIQQYNDTGQIKFAEWDDENKVLSWLHGVVPMPADYQQTFRMDFLTYTGNTTDPPPGDSNLWTGIGEDTWDGHQMFFASPLTADQMEAIGFEPPDECPADLDGNGVVDVSDLLALLGNWGNSGVGDIDDNGVVDVQDLLLLLGEWGAC